MIRFGPAGIPLSCKGRTLRDGIIDMHHIGLTAMEVQFIKVNSAQREVLPEEIGKRPREITDHLVIEVTQPGHGGKDRTPTSLDTPLTKKDHVTTLNWFLAKDYGVLAHARTLAHSVDVRLSMHAPFYVDFLNNPAARERSIHNFQWSCAIASALGVDVLVGHLGFYGPGGADGSLDRTLEEMKSIRRWLDGLPGGPKILLGIEPNGHPEVMGSRAEVLEIAKTVPRSIPVLNIPHLAVREGTNFENKAAMVKLLDEFAAATRGDLYINFSGVNSLGQGSFRMTPIKRGLVKFENVADVLCETGYDATVISSSPLMEHDAMYMKLLYDRALSKLFAKRASKLEAARQERQKKLEAEAKAKVAAQKKRSAPPSPKRKAPPPGRGGKKSPASHPHPAKPVKHASQGKSHARHK